MVVESEKRIWTKLVEVLVAIFSDAGSIPAASTMISCDSNFNFRSS